MIGDPARGYRAVGVSAPGDCRASARALGGLGGFGRWVDEADPLELCLCGGLEPDGQVTSTIGECDPTGETKTPHHVFDTWVTVPENLKCAIARSG